MSILSKSDLERDLESGLGKYLYECLAVSGIAGTNISLQGWDSMTREQKERFLEASLRTVMEFAAAGEKGMMAMNLLTSGTPQNDAIAFALSAIDYILRITSAMFEDHFPAQCRKLLEDSLANEFFRNSSRDVK